MRRESRSPEWRWSWNRVPEVSSEGLSFSLPAFLAKSTDQGEFRFEAVSPGRYYLGTNLGVRNSPYRARIILDGAAKEVQFRLKSSPVKL